MADNEKNKTFQHRVKKWLLMCFGIEPTLSKDQRNQRFFEEAIELVQAAGMSEYKAKKLIEHVYARPKGEIKQEVGGVMISLMGLCSANNVDAMTCGEDELLRVENNVEKIRFKQQEKLTVQEEITHVFTDPEADFMLLIWRYSGQDVREQVNQLMVKWSNTNDATWLKESPWKVLSELGFILQVSETCWLTTDKLNTYMRSLID